MANRRLSLPARAFLSVTFVSLLLVQTVACSDDEDAGSDPKASCDTMCKGAGFTSSNLSQQSNETNCFCQGGTGNVSDTACTDMCKSVSKPGKTFGSAGTTKNACQCQ